MLTLRAIQAAFGDSILLEFGTPAAPRSLLIDGGPRGVYDSDLRDVLGAIRAAGRDLDLVVLSHVDNDHVVGLLDYFADLEKDQADGTRLLPRAGELWHNSFADTIGKGNDFAGRLRAAVSLAAAPMEDAARSLLGIGEGRQLRIRAAQLGLPLNQPAAGGAMTTDAALAPVAIGNLTLRVVGPSEAQLARLRKEWEKWLAKNESRLGTDPQVARMADQSVPNLSSLVLWAEADGKTVLLTGDARGDFIIQGLEAAGLKKKGKPLAMDVLKLPHHGSNRNVDQAFFEALPAQHYLVSADGTYDNPDLDTLGWIAKAAKARGTPATIWATNETPATTAFQKKFRPPTYPCHLRFRDQGNHTLDLPLAP